MRRNCPARIAWRRYCSILPAALCREASEARPHGPALQAGIVARVAFWASHGQGLTAENTSAIATFGGAYPLVILVEPLVDLAVLAAAKALHGMKGNAMLERRLYQTA